MELNVRFQIKGVVSDFVMNKVPLTWYSELETFQNWCVCFSEKDFVGFWLFDWFQTQVLLNLSLAYWTTVIWITVHGERGKDRHNKSLCMEILLLPSGAKNMNFCTGFLFLFMEKKKLILKVFFICFQKWKSKIKLRRICLPNTNKIDQFRSLV